MALRLKQFVTRPWAVVAVTTAVEHSDPELAGICLFELRLRRGMCQVTNETIPHRTPALLPTNQIRLSPYVAAVSVHTRPF